MRWNNVLAALLLQVAITLNILAWRLGDESTAPVLMILVIRFIGFAFLVGCVTIVSAQKGGAK